MRLGYAAIAATTEHRIKAVGVVVPVNLGRALRQALTTPGAIRESLETMGRQRTLEARGGAQRREPRIPDSPDAAREAGIYDPDTIDAVDFYRTARGFDEHSTNRLYLASNGLLGYDAFHLVEVLLTWPLQVVVGGRLGTTFSYADGLALFERAPNARGFVVVEGASHYQMYDKPEYVDQAVEHLDGFFKEHLG